MDCERVEHMIENFLSRRSSDGFCQGCILRFAPISASDDQVAARHLLSNTVVWEKRRWLGRCALCLSISDVYGWGEALGDSA